MAASAVPAPDPAAAIEWPRLRLVEAALRAQKRVLMVRTHAAHRLRCFFAGYFGPSSALRIVAQDQTDSDLGCWVDIEDGCRRGIVIAVTFRDGGFRCVDPKAEYGWVWDGKSTTPRNIAFVAAAPVHVGGTRVGVVAFDAEAPLASLGVQESDLREACGGLASLLGELMEESVSTDEWWPAWLNPDLAPVKGAGSETGYTRSSASSTNPLGSSGALSWDEIEKRPIATKTLMQLVALVVGIFGAGIGADRWARPSIENARPAVESPDGVGQRALVRLEEDAERFRAALVEACARGGDVSLAMNAQEFVGNLPRRLRDAGFDDMADRAGTIRAEALAKPKEACGASAAGSQALMVTEEVVRLLSPAVSAISRSGG